MTWMGSQLKPIVLPQIEMIQHHWMKSGCRLYFYRWLEEKYKQQHGIMNIISLPFLYDIYAWRTKVLCETKHIIRLITDCLQKYIGLFKSTEGSALSELLWTWTPWHISSDSQSNHNYLPSLFDGYTCTMNYFNSLNLIEVEKKFW